MSNEEQFSLSVVPPFRLDFTVWALRRRQKNLIDRWDEDQYSRAFIVEGKVLRVVVEQKSEAELAVIIKSNMQTDRIQFVTKQIQKILGTDTNLEAFYQAAGKDMYLKSLASMFKGIKPPRFPTIFETLLNSIACQQVTLDLGIILLNRLAEKYGMKYQDIHGVQYAFPRPEDLYEASEEDIKKLGFSYQKARAIVDLSKAVVEKEISFEGMEEASNVDIVSRLMKIRGIGRWSAEYALLRGFGRIDMFPGDDVGAQKNLMLLMSLTNRPDYEKIQQLTTQWKPYAGLVYFHLLLERLQQRNFLPEGAEKN